MILRMMKTVFPTFAFCIALSLMLLPTQCLAQDFEIEIAPKVINLQCGGEDFSIHTNIPCGVIDGEVCLSIEGAECEGDCCGVWNDRAQCDNRGNFVGKFEVEDVVEGLRLEAGSYRLVMSGTMAMDGEPFTAAQECEMECDDEEEDDDCEIECEELKVIDNPKSCSSNNDEEDEDEESKKTERISSRIRKLIQCMQE